MGMSSEELLSRGYHVIGVDNLSKYGAVTRSFDDNPNYEFHEIDAQDPEKILELLPEVSHLLAGAALIGGISYFHTFAYDLLAKNSASSPPRVTLPSRLVVETTRLRR